MLIADYAAIPRNARTLPKLHVISNSFPLQRKQRRICREVLHKVLNCGLPARTARYLARDEPESKEVSLFSSLLAIRTHE
jgi:hypothetical protein